MPPPTSVNMDALFSRRYGNAKLDPIDIDSTDGNDELGCSD